MNKNIDFITSPFDIDSVDIITNIYKLRTIKIPSGEITNAPFLIKIGKTKCKIILSTCMSTLKEIETALGSISFGYMNSGQIPNINLFKKAYNWANKAISTGKLLDKAYYQRAEVLVAVAEYNMSEEIDFCDRLVYDIAFSDYDLAYQNGNFNLYIMIILHESKRIIYDLCSRRSFNILVFK